MWGTLGRICQRLNHLGGQDTFAGFGVIPAEAARKLNLSAPTATRAVAAQEAQVGTELLVRTIRHVRLIGSGERKPRDCRRLLNELDETEAPAAGTHLPPLGRTLSPVMSIMPMAVDPWMPRIEAARRESCVRVATGPPATCSRLQRPVASVTPTPVAWECAEAAATHCNPAASPSP